MLAEVLDSYNAWVQHLAEPFTLTFSVVDDALAGPAAAAGLHPSQIKLILTFLMAYPLGSLMRNLPSSTAKHVFSLVIGLLFAQFCIGTAWIHSFITVTLSYLLIRFLPATIAPWGVLAVTLVYLVYAHFRRMFNPDLNVDFSGPQMVLTIKLTTMAFALLDGCVAKRQKAKADKSDTSIITTAPKKTDGDNHGAPSAINELPSPLEFYGFNYYFASFFVGPAFHYQEYLSSVTGSKYRLVKNASGQIVPHEPKGLHISTLRLLMFSLLYFAYYTLLVPTFNIPGLVTPEVLSLPLLRRFAYFWVTLSVERTKYYFAWTVTEGACVAAGFGWNYKNGTSDASAKVGSSPSELEGSWDGVNNMDVWAFETAQSIRDTSVAWNRLTSAWLKFAIYQRTPPAFRTMATYTVSAFWHGFYPGYYVFFVSAAVFQNVGIMWRRRIRPYFVQGSLKQYKTVYDALCVIFIPFVTNYLSSSFLLLHIKDIWTFWSNWYFVGHVFCLLFFVICQIVPPYPEPKKDKILSEKKVL